MEGMEKVYHDLTGVDIDQQRILWDERGRGYYGEYLVFREIYPNVSGNCKILMNLRIPTANGRSTEIDLLMIHETGLYVFEVKHYKGTIYGKPDEAHWTQYFRTAPNQSFQSPVAQNQYHIRALENMFPGLRAHSFIVFTHPDCDLRVECTDANITVCELISLDYYLRALAPKPTVLNTEQIDGIFRQLLPFAPIMQHPVTVSNKEIPFYEFVNEINSNYHSQVQAAENECHSKVTKAEASCREQIKENEASCLRKIQSANGQKAAAISASIFACVICIALSVFVCFQYHTYAHNQIAAAEQELSEFAQKFEHVQAFNNGDLAFSDNLIMVSNVVLEPSSDIENTTVFSCKLTHNGSDYGIFTSKDTAITIILKDGTVKECNVFNEKYPHNSDIYLGDSWAKESTILPHEFYDTAIDDIAYVKLTNVGIWTYVQHQRKTISNTYEIEIYRTD